MNHDSDIVCVGQEVMSQGHYTIFMRQGINGHQQLTDSVLHDVLRDALVGLNEKYWLEMFSAFHVFCCILKHMTDMLIHIFRH